jgi:hypothetical protein
MRLRIIALTGFGLSFRPSSRRLQVLQHVLLFINLCVRDSTFMIEVIIKITVLKSLKSVCG